jgi:hypothetical protein
MDSKVPVLLSIVTLLSTVWMPQVPAADWTPWLGPAGGVRLRARLRGKDENARKHQASVEVEVENAFLHAPNGLPQRGVQEAEIKYQVDHDAPVVTTDTRITFQEIPSGAHTIAVALIGADNRLLAPAAKIPLQVP